MSKVGVGLRLDVSKIDKERLYRGAKGTYLDATVFVDLDEKDQYDQSGMITQDVTKEEKEKGEKGAILGNCRVFWKGEGGKAPQNNAPNGRSPAEDEPPVGDDMDSDIPF